MFTAGTLRPLLKLTLYAESTSPLTKGIYLRKREDLILRVEARTPNDDDGTYQLFFGGSFEPIVGGAEPSEEESSPTETAATSGDRKTKRVSSVGARLPEPEKPVSEVATAPTPTPEPTPSATPGESPEVTPRKVTAPKSTVARTPPRTRRSPGRRTTTATPVKTKPTEKPVVAEEDTKKEKATEVPDATKPKPTARNTRRGATATATARAPKPEPVAPEPEPESGPRLIIETNDGTLINRSMSSVRRVIVENGQVVVTGKDGKIDRIPLVNVLRMSIAQ